MWEEGGEEESVGILMQIVCHNIGNRLFIFFFIALLHFNSIQLYFPPKIIPILPFLLALSSPPKPC